MNRAAPTMLLLGVLLFPGFAATLDNPTGSIRPDQGWQRSGVLMVLTTLDGANLPAEARIEGFPSLVRLHKDWFDFTQAKANGEDARFSSSNGAPLAYQIEEWDAAKGLASVWVLIPLISGNERQEIKIHWSKSGPRRARRAARLEKTPRNPRSLR